MEKIGWHLKFSSNEDLDMGMLINLLGYKILNYNLSPKSYRVFDGYKDTKYIITDSGIILHYIPHYNVIKEVNQWLCRGYKKVGFRMEDGRYFQCFAHRAVAFAFIPNPENKPEVNHKNRIKTDNHVKNLEWVTKSENEKHKWRIGQKMNDVTKKKIGDAQRGGKSCKAKKVICIETGETWDTAKEASFAMGRSRNVVSQSIARSGAVKGFHFRFL